jgi:hypothetical protein
MYPDENGVTFYYTSMFPLSGFEKGWEFVTEGGHHPDSSLVVQTLDGIENDVEPYGRRYRSLGDGWYLFLLNTTEGGNREQGQ